MDGKSDYDPLLGVLSDGIGGLPDGDRAAELVVNSFVGYIEDCGSEERSARLEQSARVANRAIVKEFQGPAISGATLIGFYVFERKLYWVSVGDSLLFLYREGTLVRLNEDHSAGTFLDRAVQAGTITRSDALSHPRRKALLSYIGGEVIESIDCDSEGCPLQPNDIIIAASEGNKLDSRKRRPRRLSPKESKPRRLSNVPRHSKGN